MNGTNDAPVRLTGPGFDLGLLRDIRVRAGGDSRHVVVLPLQTLEDTVTVGRNGTSVNF